MLWGPDPAPLLPKESGITIAMPSFTWAHPFSHCSNGHHRLQQCQKQETTPQILEQIENKTVKLPSFNSLSPMSSIKAKQLIMERN